MEAVENTGEVGKTRLPTSDNAILDVDATVPRRFANVDINEGILQKSKLRMLFGNEDY